MKKVKMIGANTGRVYMVDPHKVLVDDKTKIKYVKTATEFAFEAVEKEVKEVKTPRKTATKAKPVEKIEKEDKKEAE